MIRHPYLCLLVLGATLAVADDQWILDCAAIADDADRLTCYDRLGRGALQNQRDAQSSESVAPIASPAHPPAQEAKAQRQIETPKEEALEERDFGKPPPKVDSPVDQIRSRIVSVAVSARGQRIMTLANGQVWMENEAGKRAIPVTEDVTISKRLFRYAMRFESGSVIAVKRAD
jgi:hypothetical protein